MDAPETSRPERRDEVSELICRRCGKKYDDFISPACPHCPDGIPAAPARADAPPIWVNHTCAAHEIAFCKVCPVEDEEAPPSPATERPGAERCGLTRLLAEWKENAAFNGPLDHYHEGKRDAITLCINELVAVLETPPHSSPERERAQDTPPKPLTTARVEEPNAPDDWKSALVRNIDKAAEIRDDAMNMRPWSLHQESMTHDFIRKQMWKHRAEIAALLRPDVELVALREQMAQARELLNRAGKAPYMRAIQLGDDIRAFLAETGGER